MSRHGCAPCAHRNDRFFIFSPPKKLRKMTIEREQVRSRICQGKTTKRTRKMTLVHNQRPNQTRVGDTHTHTHTQRKSILIFESTIANLFDFFHFSFLSLVLFRRTSATYKRFSCLRFGWFTQTSSYARNHSVRFYHRKYFSVLHLFCRRFFHSHFFLSSGVYVWFKRFFHSSSVSFVIETFCIFSW